MSERERNRNHNHNNRDRDRERDRDRDRNRERDREREGDRDREGDRERDRDRRGRRRHFEFRPRGGGKRIPDRWLNYNGMGIRVHGTRFLPFKTPLHTHICENSKLGAKSFDIQSILQSCKEDGNRIGLVIDLTNTDKYYNSSDWARNGIEYIKLRCPGHEVHEREDVVKEFNRIVDSFLKIREDHDLIGVHCTHGINRTGYLICRYLIEREKWTAQQAIESFEFARGYTIERPQYKVKLAAVEKELGLIKDTAGDSEVVSSDEKLQTRMETSEEGASSRMETSEEGASSRIEQSHDEDVGKSC